MSFSFRLPKEDPICQCRYDELHDRMDREDCPFHCKTAEDTEPTGVLPAERKPPTSVTGACHRKKSTYAKVDRGFRTTHAPEG